MVVVVPCYNEADRFDASAFLQSLEEHPDVDFLFVDDGSSDRTAEVLEKLRSRAPERVTVLGLVTNRGKAEAVRQGFQAAFAASPRFVAFWDADLATPLAEIPRFLNIVQSRPEIEMVFGSRVKLMGRQVHRKMWRHYLGRIFATLVSVWLRLPIYDSQCGAKVFRNGELIRSVMASPFETRWLFDVEILVRAITTHEKGAAGLCSCTCELPLNAWRDVPSGALASGAYLRAAVSLTRVVWRYEPDLRRTRARLRT